MNIDTKEFLEIFKDSGFGLTNSGRAIDGNCINLDAIIKLADLDPKMTIRDFILSTIEDAKCLGGYMAAVNVAKLSAATVAACGWIKEDSIIK